MRGDAPAREHAYFSGARPDDDQLRAAADEDRQRRAGEPARQTEAIAIDDSPATTVDLAAHRGESGLEELDLGDDDRDVAA